MLATGAVARARRHTVRRRLRRVWQAFISVRMANLLLGAIAQGGVKDVEDVWGGWQGRHLGTLVGIIGRVCRPGPLSRARFSA